MASPEFRDNTFAKISEQRARQFRPKTITRRIRVGLFSLILPMGIGMPAAVTNYDSAPVVAYMGRSETKPTTTPPTTIFEAARTTTTRPKPKETTNTQKPKPSSNTAAGERWTGLASYYSRAGCLGCSPDRTMANGQPLDDNALTVAFNRAALGTHLKITNRDNNQSVVSEVTDTGGFEKLGKIIDLNLATKNAIGCNAPCTVYITRA